MQSLRSVLVVLEGNEQDRGLLEKVTRLARPHGARVQLFSCDWESARLMMRSYDQRDHAHVRAVSLERQRLHQQNLLKQLLREGLEGSAEAAWEPTYYEAIVRMAMRCRPDLVVKRVGAKPSGRHSALTAGDWQLVRTCPVPLLLARSGSWAELPQVAAVLDRTQEAAGLSAKIVRTAQYMRGLCGGDLALLFGEEIYAARAQEPAPAGESEPRRYDLMVLGATTRGQRLTELVGTLARLLIETLSSDLLLLPSAPANRSGQSELRFLSVAAARPQLRLPRSNEQPCSR
jgi:universal stress protein E